MPCPHNEISIVQRSQQQSAVAAAAYQSGEKLFCEYDQQVKHYPEKRGIVHNEILLPANAPQEYADRNTLWNAAEAVEKQWNSQLARRWVLTIPREIPPDQYAVLVREFCQQQFVSKGMIEDAEGKPKRVLNKRETMLAQQKQQVIKDAFANWVWQDPQRRIALVRQYNELFNSTRPREYDGSHIKFVGMNPEITLREHQRNAIAHVLYGGNTLLAHEVGAGKTFEMAASAMEAKRLGLCQKSLFVVPNHLTEQWASEFLNLYPNAKLLVARRKDFETANRKKFCARIATGDYDAVIIGHSQFERIPLSFERQERIIQEQIYETLAAINELKAHAGENFSIKQMEKTRKTLETKLEKLRSDERKDDVITFEQLGVDRLFVDESHFYKNRAKRCA